MIISLNKRQLEKLSSLFLDTSKGLLLTGFAAPALSPLITAVFMVEIIFVASLLILITMWIEELIYKYDTN